MQTPFHRRVPLGRTFPRRGLGFDFNWNALGQTLEQAPALLGGVAQVVKAANTPGVPYSAAGYPTYSNPYQQTGPGFTAQVGASSGTYIMVALVVAGLAFVMLGRK